MILVPHAPDRPLAPSLSPRHPFLCSDANDASCFAMQLLQGYSLSLRRKVLPLVLSLASELALIGALNGAATWTKYPFIF